MASFLSASTSAATAWSIPRLRSIGFIPAATYFIPSRTVACASNVAVVVPSPATSEVLDATSRTIRAPRFSNGSGSSISFATATPELITIGAPYARSSTTVRAFGPSVPRTASASTVAPRRIFSRAASWKRICFAVMVPSVSL